VKAEGTPDWLVPARTFEGNRPTSTLIAERLDPATLGRIVALYEHAVFTQGDDLEHRFLRPVGVELGKVLAVKIIPELESDAPPAAAHDGSTSSLIRRYRAARGRKV
jgi:glucose-6-phosphate isomerase